MAEPEPEPEVSPTRPVATSSTAKRPTAPAAKVPPPVGAGGGGGGGGGNGGGPPGRGTPGPNGFGDPFVYPILTEEVAFPAPSPAPAAAPGAAPLGLVVEGAIRQVLGWRPKVGDSKGFVSALNQSFSLAEIEGHTEVTWTPRTYAAEVPAGLGAITGAQASIYARAKVALDQSLPLLKGLQMLDISKDPDDADAMRAIVEAEMRELVALLGTEGGPPITRVEQLFGQLGAKTGATEVEDVTGHLAILVDRFGLEPGNVNTIDEEQNLTNFIVVADYFNGLRASWDALKPYFYLIGGKPAFLGTELVLVARALEVVAESVQELNFLMDSVFLGPAERQTILLKFDHDSLFFADLINLVLNATQEGPRLFQDAGKDGVVAFVPTIAKLRDLVSGAMLTTKGGQQDPSDSDLPAGYKRERVQVGLQDLVASLDQVYERATRITRAPGPTISSFAYHPDPYPHGYHDLKMDIYGTHFDPSSVVTLIPITPGAETEPVGVDPHFASAGHLHGTADVSGQPPGTWDLKVENPDGGFTLLEDAFTIEPPPVGA